MSHPATDERERRRFVADPDALSALGMGVDDLGDPDVRSLVIRHEHPELQEAITDNVQEVDLGEGPINPRLHLTMHEIVATQLWDGDPPEVWEAAVRLRDAGYRRHEIIHMLGSTLSDQIWAALHDHQAYDRDRHVAALEALPGSWERERSTLSLTRQHDDARKRARRAARVARRRNRRPK